MNKYALYRRLASGILSCAVAAGLSPGCLQALAAEDPVSQETLAAMQEDYYYIEPVDTGIPTHSEYFDQYSGENRPDVQVEVRGNDYVSAENGDFASGSYGSEGDVRDDVLIWESADGLLTYKVDVPETGNYCINMTYFPIESNSSSVELSMKIDGVTPFDTASRITLSRIWVNETDIYTDSRGNQVRPSQIQKGMWRSCDLGDVDGLFNEPLFFYLEKGTHEISFYSERAQLAIESFKLYNPEELPSYSQYASSAEAGVSKESTPAKVFRIEGEDAVFKSDSTLYPTYDNTNYLVSPSDPTKVVYNTLGSGNWKKALQSVTWEIPADQIGSSGWYRIGIKSRQNTMRGFYSNRRVYIDGQVPCSELDQVKFYYGTDWSVVTPQTDSGEDVYVYLDAGQDHTITMEVIPGEIGDSMRKLDEVVAELNTYYRKILMITGPSPDQYTDYYVHEKIPELVDEFDRLSGELKDIQSGIESLSGSEGSEAAALERMTVILDKCTKKPLKIPDYLSQIKENITSISAWMRDYRDQPLEVDYIEFASQGADFAGCDTKLGKSISFGVKGFFGSFFEDYTTLSDVTGEDAIDVWVSLGRDQAQVVKEMAENQFMQDTGIPISVNLVIGGVVEATLAGKGPDVALFLGGEFPVNLAARDLLVDVSDTTQFPDFEQVSQRFQENAMTPYQFNGGTYGLPISQTWPILFYRTDVLTELGYTSPPETWNDLIDMLPALQRNYMSVGLILPPTNISPATEAGHTFAMLLLQKGLNYYNEGQTASTFDSIEAVQSFEEWTDFYTKYSFDQTYDAFSRFRTGEYPILIANYTFFNQLTVASPEIKGLWDFCQVPGTLREDGTISHAANSNGAGAVIFKKVKNKQNAWEFIKWFTEADTQVQYGTQIEGLLGTMGRFDTANLEALSELSWSHSEYDRLKDQQDELVEIPVIPSSYAVTRNIMNAFREVVNELENPRDTLVWYNRDINDEITRKRENLGLDTDEN
ncbi:MAG TPA: extracellular solute-binding protein [Ruminococcus sp.]|nr:extracellular solute-binding protein [Ruminococcus sp.]